MKNYTYSKEVKRSMRKPRFNYRRILKKAGSAMKELLVFMILVFMFLAFFWYAWGGECEYQNAVVQDYFEMKSCE